MRRLLRRRPTNNASDTPASTPVDPNADPPIVAALVEPLLQLRASLGSGVATPDQSVVNALSTASTQAADAEGPHREGLHALESTWTSRAADDAVPALRTTQTQIGDITDRGPEYLSVLGDAHATSARAAQKVDQIIADFRRDAKQIMSTASASSDSDAVIARATQALRDAVTAVSTAQSEMDDHTARLDAMGPLTVTTPQGVGTTQQTVVPGTTNGVTTAGVTTTTPLDPVQAAQLQLQQYLINAGVSVGTAAIDAGVNIGTHLIDKIAEVGTHAMDTVAASADKVIDKAIPELIHPGSTTNSPTGGDSASKPTNVIDFGGGSGQSSKPAPNIGTNSVIPPNLDGPTATKPAPAPGPQAPAASADAPPSRPSGPEPTNQPGTTGGLAMPPSSQSDEDRRPRDGQLGVTVPTVLATVPPAVIGEFDNDEL
ncbi:hypothetical protein OIE68_16295 [Nocardia vinacea]|uniref:hypothetical protein n=1 Tax=Nocardia vinacea TaxID=96468 RepID=UPI002E0D14BF|nr:hypothetical protein OIE68_16295 [Nocardia vinacea]